MAGTVADVYMRARPETTGFGSELQNKTIGPAGNAGEAAGHHFGKKMLAAVAASVAAATGILAAGVVSEVKKSVAAASDLSETSSKVGVVFGKSAENVRRWSKNMASDFGQSQKQALDAAATFAIYGQAAKLTGHDLFNFSTHMTTLASDMASFSNSTPEEAIAAIGSALRGEFDPIERYGVLLNETVVKNEALRKGLIKTTTDALTPQQRVLAVQSLIMKQTSLAQGDFERTSAGLANQQRIAAAETENLRARIGQGFLPVATKLYNQFNTQIIPAFNDLWTKHGPAVTRVVGQMGEKFGDFVEKVLRGDFAGYIDRARDAFEKFKVQAGPALDSLRTSIGPASDGLKNDLVPALKQLKEDGGQGLSDAISVGAIALKFMAEHSDLLAKALPYLVGGLVAFKVAQLASNVAAAFSPALRIAEVVATRQQTQAIIANTAAKTGETAATTGGTIATGAGVVAENLSIAAKARAIVIEKAKLVGMALSTAGTWLLTAATTALGVAIKIASGPIGIIIGVVALLAAGIVYLYKNNETARKIIDAVWAAIKTAVKAVGDWFSNTLWPSLKKSYDQIVTGVTWVKDKTVEAFNTWRERIHAAYAFVKNNVFDPLVRLIFVTVPDAFRNGVAAIGRGWDKLKALASTPVKFVVETVINKAIIGTFNKVSGFFGGPKVPNVSLPSGMGDGPGHGGGHPPHGSGQGDGIGDFLGFLKGPVGWVKSRVTGVIDKIGDTPFGGVLKGASGKLLGSLVDKAQSLLSFSGGSGGGGGVGAGGLRTGILGVLAALRGAFGPIGIISGLRPGSRTLTGNVSYHSSGRAIDIAPVYAWAAFLNRTFGGRLRELITPWNDLNIWNGRPHRYSGAVWNQHNFAGGNAHIHAAMDDGGRRVLQPGMNLISNNTGGAESIYGPAEISQVVELLAQMIAVLRTVAPDVAAALVGRYRGAAQLARSRG